MRDKTVPQKNSPQEREAFALKQCLDYLEGAAEDAGLYLTAHLINLAAEAATQPVQPQKDEIITKTTSGRAQANSCDRKPKRLQALQSHVREPAF